MGPDSSVTLKWTGALVHREAGGDGAFAQGSGPPPNRNMAIHAVGLPLCLAGPRVWKGYLYQVPSEALRQLSGAS